MLKRSFKTMLAEANAVIETISVQDLAYHLEDGDTLLVKGSLGSAMGPIVDALCASARPAPAGPVDA